MGVIWSRHTTLFAACALALATSSCGDEGGGGDSVGTGQVLVSIAAVPPSVWTITATIGAETISLSPDGDAATGTLTVAEGEQVLQVDAYNGNDVLLYLGRDTVQVVADQQVDADVQLVCVSDLCDGGQGGGTGSVWTWAMFPASEVEPNDIPASCNMMNLSVNAGDPNTQHFVWAGNGAMSSSADADVFCIPQVYPGDTIQVMTYSSSLGSDISSLDPFVYLLNPGASLAASNDDGGPGNESFLTYVADQAGTWYVGVTSCCGLTAGAPPRYTVRVKQAW